MLHPDVADDPDLLIWPAAVGFGEGEGATVRANAKRPDLRWHGWWDVARQ